MAFFRQRLMLTLLAVSAPVVTIIILIMSQANPLSFSPVWSDEIFYWHQILTFKVAGFQGGYYTINEAGAAATFTHFYTYGPWFPMIYGSIARVTGWERITFIVFNIGFVAAALALFCKVARLQGRQLILLGLTMATFWCLIVFLPTAMQEAFQQTLAIGIALILLRAFSHREKISWGWYFGGLAFLTLAALMRTSWALFFFPFVWLTARPSSISRLGSLMLGVVLLIAVYVASQYTGSPGNNSISTLLGKFSLSFSEGWLAFWDSFNFNLGRFFDVSKEPLDVLQTAQVVTLAGSALPVAVYQIVHKRPAAEAVFHVYNLLSIIAAACALYIVAGWGDYRVIGTHLMVSLLLLIAYKRYLPLHLFIVTNLLFVSAFYAFFQPEVIAKYQVNTAAIETLQHEIETVAPYQPNASNAWCNTVIFPVTSFHEVLTAVPGGMGLSFFKDARVPGYRSQYLIVDQSTYDIIQSKENPPVLEPLLTTVIGILYRNLSANCPS